MDFLLNRYRNLTVLLVVIVVQLLLLAYQVKTNKDVPLMRVWAVSTVTPVEQGLEFVRRHTFGFAGDYFDLVHVREDNDRLQRDVDRLKLENHYLRNELSTADRVKELNTFRQETPSQTLVARAIGNGTGANSKTIFIDRGTTAGVENGMAAITPDGIVGKVVAVYPTASLVMLMTDPSFAAGVVSQKNHVHGTLKGLGGPKCRVDYVQNEEKIDPGEWFYTSGDDGIFPRGFPAGQVASVQNGRTSKEIIVTPSGWQGGLDEVLIVTEGVHQPIPAPQIAAAPVKILPPPADQSNTGKSPNTAALATDADKLRQEYKQIGDQEKIQFGAIGTKPPDFSKVGKPPVPAQTQAQAPAQPPPAGVPGVSKAPAQPPASPATGPVTTQKAPSTPGATTATGPGVRLPSTPGAATATGPVLKPTSTSSTAIATTVKQAPSAPVPGAGSALKSPATPPNTAAGAPNKTVQRSSAAPGSQSAAAPSKPQPRPPILETDPTDADLANEAVAERIQRERSNAKAISEDKNTEILAPAAPPKSKPAVPKTVPPKTPGPVTGTGRTGAATP